MSEHTAGTYGAAGPPTDPEATTEAGAGAGYSDTTTPGTAGETTAGTGYEGTTTPGGGYGDTTAAGTGYADTTTAGTGYAATTTGTSGATTSDTTSTKDQATEAAKDVAGTAKDEAASVAETAKEQAGNVAGEARDQARQLWHQSRQELMDQTDQQQQRVAGLLRDLADDLSSMSRNSERSGVAGDVVREVSDRASSAASWLEQRDPGSLMTEVRQFARRRPGAFLALAAGVGVLGGRLSRALVDENRDSGSAQGSNRSGEPMPVDHSTTGYSAYGSPTGAQGQSASGPVTAQTGAPLESIDPSAGLTAPGQTSASSIQQEPR